VDRHKPPKTGFSGDAVVRMALPIFEVIISMQGVRPMVAGRDYFRRTN
jgi:hypothetical protein